MPSEAVQAVDDLGKAFREFKIKNDARLEEMAGQLDSIEAMRNRPRGMGDHAMHDIEGASAFNSWMRSGLESDLVEMQANLNIGTGSDGGFTVPEIINNQIERQVELVSPMRRICRVIRIETVPSRYKKLVNKRGTASGWVGEVTARPETNTPSIESIDFPDGEIYANPAATQWMLEDSQFDLVSWLSEEVTSEFSKQEGVAFISGDGTNKPEGFLNGTPVATDDDSRAFGVLQYLPGGHASLLNDPDTLIDVVYKLNSAYRDGAWWVMNSKTLSVIRKLKDTQNQYLWQPSNQQGQPSLLMGYPVLTAEDMPDIAANAFPVAFGNFDRGYHILDRASTVLRDEFTNKPFVHFYTRKRLSGKLVNSDAIKLLKIATT